MTVATENSSWKEAWNASPGPDGKKESATLAAKGFCMGVADIIPGVSGGTIAFITGIYDNLLAAIASIDLETLRALARFDVKGALTRVHLRFLVTLLCGIGFAIFSLAHLMHYLLEDHRTHTHALFFGLIGASILFVGREVKDWRCGAPLFAVSAVGSYLLVGLVPYETPDALWFILLCGMVAICAMILPGISGSFILLLLNKYAVITGAVKAFYKLPNLQILVVFAVGAVVGITLFSRLLRWCLTHIHNATMAVLTGLMLGAMRRIWPWQDQITKTIGIKVKSIGFVNLWPASIDGSFLLALVLIVIGFLAVVLLERWAAPALIERD